MTLAAVGPRLALGLLVGLAAFLLLTQARLPSAHNGGLTPRIAARWLTLGAVAAFEELVWRGLALGGLVAAVGPGAALVVSTAGFALWHLPGLGRRCAVHAVTGLAFGTAFLAGGIWAAILAHVLYNVLVDWAVHAELAARRGS